MVDALGAAVLRQGAVGGVGPVLPPRHDVLFLVPLPILLPEALRAEGPGGQHDMGVRVLALAAVEGDIRDQVSRPSSEPPSASLQSAANRAPVAPGAGARSEGFDGRRQLGR